MDKKRIAKALPAIVYFLFLVGLQVSGYENIYLTWTAWAIGAFLLFFYALINGWLNKKVPAWSIVIIVGLLIVVFLFFGPDQAGNMVKEGTTEEKEELSDNDKLVLKELRELYGFAEPAYQRMYDMRLNIPVERPPLDKKERLIVNNMTASRAEERYIELTLGLRQENLRPDDPSFIQTSENLQKRFGDFFAYYETLVRQVHEFCNAIDFPLSDYSDYQRWRDEDKRFMDRLREIIPREEFATLRETSENLITSGERVRDSVTLSGNLLGHIIRIAYTKDRTASATAIAKRLSDLGADVKLGSPADEIGPDVSVLHYYADPKLAIAVEIQKAIEDLLKVEIEKRTHPNNRRALAGVPLIGSSYDFTLYISEK